MKILHLCREKNGGIIGGVEYHIRYIAREQLHLGHEPMVMSIRSSRADRISSEMRDGVMWYFLDVKSPFYKISSRLKKFENGGIGFLVTALERLPQNFALSTKLSKIAEFSPDIIHQHDYLSSVRLSKKLSARYRIVFTNHYGEYLAMQKTMLTRALQKRFLRSFSSIIAPSKELLPAGGNCHYLPNGVDTSAFKVPTAEEKQIRRKQHEFDEKIVFLCARRWAPSKGILHLARALNMLEKSVAARTVFLFAGNDSEDFPQYRQAVHQELSKTRADVRLLGNIDHKSLQEVFEMTDIGIIPSVIEGMSLFSIELIASGIPVLATDVGGNPEVVADRINGWLIPPQQSKAICCKLMEIVSDWPATSLNIDTVAFRERYSWRSIAAATLKIYEGNYEDFSSDRHTAGSNQNGTAGTSSEGT